MTRLLVVTGTRADLGLWRPVLAEVQRRDQEADTVLLVMGMHLDPRFGGTVDEVRASGARIAAEIAFIPEGDSSAEMAAGLGTALSQVPAAMAAAAPDWVMVLGDRGEQLVAAIAALHLGIPVAHLHGGERTLGAIDDTLRDLISRIASLHLVATHGAARRLRELGEEDWRIRLTGAPGLDAILARDTARDDQIRAEFGAPADGPYVLLVQHPETAAGKGPAAAGDAIAASLTALEEVGVPAIGIWPNADAGGRSIAELLEKSEALVRLHRSIPHDAYLALLSGAAALVGNSSSGIIEAPMLRVPAVNVGERQAGRERGDNIIDVPVAAGAVAEGLRRALDPAFRARLRGRSPYGDGSAAPRIVDEVLSTPVDDRLLVKGME